MEIAPQLLSFNQLVTGRLFRIPDYQRSYSWTSKERDDLFSDIEKVAGRPETSHFMATVVGLRRETRTIQADEFQVIEIVDGQQRLTTLVILLRAIENVLADTDELESAIRAQIGSLLVKADELAPVLLQANQDSSEYCTTYLRWGTHQKSSIASTLADRRLLQAMEECEVFVSEWIAHGRTLADLVRLLKNRLTFIFHELSDEAIVYTVFEVLNSRGLEVSWFDRLKSILMGIAFEAKTGDAKETIDELHDIWGKIYTCVGLRQGLNTEALRFSATLRVNKQPNRPLGEEDSVEVLRAATNSTAKGVIDISHWVLRVTAAVDKLYADRRIDAVTEIVHARLLAIAIHLREDIDEVGRRRLLGVWENVSFRVFGMLKKDARTGVGDYVRLAWKCATSRPSAAELGKDIRGLGLEYPIDAAIEEMRDSDRYNDWQPQLRYFLFRYEEYLAEKENLKFKSEQWNKIWADTAARSIEHVYPQGKGFGWRVKKGIFVHRLGNLLLLPPGLNSKLGAKDPIAKKPEYLKTGLAIATDVAERIPKWDRAAIERREEEMLAWARQEWAA